jgi:hypothetical protein
MQCAIAQSEGWAENNYTTYVVVGKGHHVACTLDEKRLIRQLPFFRGD